jgi:hypothetical protein
LGYIALNINNAPKIPSVDEQYRIMIDSKDLEAGEKLTDDKLDEVVEEIKKRHSAALNYMKDYLNISVISALNTKGIVPQYDGRGFICDDKDKFKVWTTPRPPKIDDYHHAEDGGSPSKKYILGPRFMEDKRRMLNAWLAGKSGIGFYSEGEILDLVDSI